MAVKNALQQRKSIAATTYEAGGSQITLTPDIVRKYLVSGSGNVTDQEIAHLTMIAVDIVARGVETTSLKSPTAQSMSSPPTPPAR